MGDVSPAGRLPTSIYAAAFADTREITDMEMRPHGATPGVTYRFLNATDPMLLYSFGYGMTYSSFAVTAGAPLELSTTTDALFAQWAAYYAGDTSGLPTVNVTVTNTGSTHTSDFSVLGFARSSLQGAPVRQLFGFERLASLLPGGHADVELFVPPQALAQVDATGTQYLVPGTWELDVGGEPDGFATFVLTVTGSPRLVFSLFD